MRKTILRALAVPMLLACGDPNTPTTIPLAVACDDCFVEAVWGNADDDVWFGGYGRGGALVLHWDGAELSDVELPEMPVATLYRLWGSGPNDVWATGRYVADDTTDVVRWDGVSWQPSFDLARGTALRFEITDLRGSAPDNVWLVGWSSEDEPSVTPPVSFAYRWDGVAWTQQDLPFAAGATAMSVWTSGPDDVAIAAIVCAATECRSSLFAWDGSAWAELAVPFGGPFSVRGTAPRRFLVFAGQRSEQTAYRWSGSAFEPLGSIYQWFDFVFVRGEDDILGGLRYAPDVVHPDYTTLHRWRGSEWTSFDVVGAGYFDLWASDTHAWIAAGALPSRLNL